LGDAASPLPHTHGAEEARLPRAVYRVARQRGNASLRILDAGVVLVAWLLAYAAGFELNVPSDVARAGLLFVGVPVVVQLLANQVAGLYGPVWRYASVDEAVRVVVATAIGALVSTAALASIADFRDIKLPLLTAPAVAALITLLGCGGIRFQARLFALERQRTRATAGTDRLRTLIVGAGSAGASLALELSSSKRDDIEVVGFIDDDAALRGRRVRGLRVLGTTDELEEICDKHRIARILVALPYAQREQIQEIIDRALRTDAQVKVLPPASEIVNGPLLRSLRDLDLADLLGREHAPVDNDEIADYIEGATVLVTGAGGSIGSEIARQVARYKPARLLLLDRDESLLHDLVCGELEVAEPILADIRDEARLRDIFDRYRPDVVFHAAAHKHVPILERHPVEAVTTNLLGTWSLARLAAQHRCRFVHISTDKAASPCSVMGASKRAAEGVVLTVGSENGLPFAAVRFGNVLGSRGSVVPTFLRQILEGGPVTVTDPEMTRYFMTIPEAVSLVLQAGAMADDAKVFLLDMGKPVSILHLARQMIRLAGLRPDDDIEIQITGPRPGERLHEQLHDDAEILEPTAHPSIWGVTPKSRLDEATLYFFLELLETKCSEADTGAAVASLLGQLLRQAGVDCRLHVEIDLEDEAQEVTVRQHRSATRLPALLGGRPAFQPGLPFARPARPALDRVMKRVEASYERGMLTNGPLVAELEDRIAERLGVTHVVATSSCTSGLMLALRAVTDDRPGYVVLPSFTFSASAHAVAWNGRIPRFVECDPHTFQIDLDDATAALDGASALLATHIFGAPCDPDELVRRADHFGVPVLFDAAHAMGALADDRPIGRFGEAEVFSLTPTKPLVAGEGGLVSTNDSGLAEAIRVGRDYGNPGDYDTRFVGLNARMSEFHAAVALESLETLEETLERRRDLAMRYRLGLAGVPGVSVQLVPAHFVSTYKDFSVTIDPTVFGLTRDQLVTALSAEGVDTRNYFDPPVHRQQSYRYLDPVHLPVTERLASSIVSLPLHTEMGEEDVDRVIEVVHDAHHHADAIVALLGRESHIGPRRVIDLRAHDHSSTLHR
jgi:FlaA1/EpsC-like NDP-sugar epimerase/dTDP-4-amino-4,6-dideoxygalactose transaminase